MKTEVIRLVSMMDNDSHGIAYRHSYYGILREDGDVDMVVTRHNAPTRILLERITCDTFTYGDQLVFVDAADPTIVAQENDWIVGHNFRLMQ